MLPDQVFQNDGSNKVRRACACVASIVGADGVIAAIFTAFLFALAGLVQWIRRKSLLKVDKEILALGGLYLIVIGFYILFELVIVNYRPIIMPGSVHPEASFPSSHGFPTQGKAKAAGAAFLNVFRTKLRKE